MNQQDTKRINIPTELARDLYASKPEGISLTMYAVQLLKAYQTNTNKEANK